MKDLQIFNFQGKDVRVKSEDGIEWFVADDIAKAINHKHTPSMVRVVDDAYKTTVLIKHNGLTDSNENTPLNKRKGYKHQAIIIAEPGVWQILTRSRKPEAEPLQKWLFEEVLPTIRKTGSYAITTKGTDNEVLAQEIKYEVMKEVKSFFGQMIPVLHSIDDKLTTHGTSISMHLNEFNRIRDILNNIGFYELPNKFDDLWNENAIDVSIESLFENVQVLRRDLDSIKPSNMDLRKEARMQREVTKIKNDLDEIKFALEEIALDHEKR